MNKPLRFNIALGRTKPVNIRNEEVRCPFCDRSKLTDILDTSGHIIWLMNKYPVLDKTWPTVIIETETDEGEFSTLPADEAARILQFGLDKWRETRERKEFKSVLFFKNHGYITIITKILRLKIWKAGSCTKIKMCASPCPRSLSLASLSTIFASSQMHRFAPLHCVYNRYCVMYCAASPIIASPITILYIILRTATTISR